MDATQWSINWWKGRHDQGYFPTMEWHLDWKVCPYPPPNFVELMKPTKKDDVLEIGCGYGEWMVPASPLVGRIYGIDIHPILEQKARETFAEHKTTNCSFSLCDGKSIPWDDAQFSIVYSISVFQHIPKATVLLYLEEADRVLELDGRFLFHFRADDGVGDYSKDIVVDHKGDFSTGWTVEEVLEAVTELGLPWDCKAELGGGHNLFLHGRKR